MSRDAIGSRFLTEVLGADAMYFSFARVPLAWMGGAGAGAHRAVRPRTGPLFRPQADRCAGLQCRERRPLSLDPPSGRPRAGRVCVVGWRGAPPHGPGATDGATADGYKCGLTLMRHRERAMG